MEPPGSSEGQCPTWRSQGIPALHQESTVPAHGFAARVHERGDFAD